MEFSNQFRCFSQKNKTTISTFYHENFQSVNMHCEVKRLKVPDDTRARAKRKRWAVEFLLPAEAERNQGIRMP